MTRWAIRKIRGGFALYLDGNLAATDECPMALVALVCDAQQVVPS